VLRTLFHRIARRAESVDLKRMLSGLSVPAARLTSSLPESLRRMSLRTGILIAMPVVVGASALVLAAPGAVRDAVVERVRSATGLSAEIEDVSVGFSGVTLRGLRIGERDSGPRARIDSLDVEGNLLSLAISGLGAVSSLRVSGVLVHVPTDAEQTLALRARLTEKGAKRSGASHAARALPDVRVAHMTLEISDARGSLVHVSEATLTHKAGALELDAQRAVIGGKSAQLSNIKARAHREPSGTRLRSVTAREAALQLPDEAAEGAGPSLQARLMAALRGERASTTPSATTAPTTSTTTTAKKSDPLERLAAGASFVLEKGRVLRPDGSEVLGGLHASIKLEPDKALRLEGKGRGERGGSVGWDLRVLPSALRAEGTLDIEALPLSVLAPLLPGLPWHEPQNARVDASLRLAAESAERIALAGELTLSNAAISSARLSAVPVRNIEIVVGGNGFFVPAARRLEIEKAELSLGKARVAVQGALTWAPPKYVIDLALKLPSTRCTDAVRSIPADLLGDLALATWQGSIGGAITVKIDSEDLPSTVLDIDVDDRCDFLTVPALADLRRFEQPFTHQVLEPDGAVFEMETGPGTPEWTYLSDISPFFVHAVIVHEDAGFYAHRGFSPLHIKNALARNLEEGRYVVGASTITMQLVKNVFLHREKTLARKIQEVLLTWWLERVMDKSDILELYFNVIEYGPGVYGIRHAARHYFGRLPAQLSPAESAWLANILPSPKRYHSMYEQGTPSASTLERMRKLIVRLQERGAYGPESSKFGLEELTHFRFVPEGSIAEPRIVPADVGPLPHMEDAALWGSERPLDGMDEPFEQAEEAAWEEAPPKAARPPKRTAPVSIHAR
jgi:hypothetical protein